jgi:DNA-binding helix-hairpin-helix protein with protein kinase domain
MTMFDASGTRLELGAKLGEGGEGTVYEVRNKPALVAKVYQKPLARESEEKIRLMVAGGDQTLLSIAAWPTSSIHSRPGGAIVGFLMPKLDGYYPIHKIYSPAHRKQQFPKADWAFLVHATRNTAVAFAGIHSRGHVVGDVNQGNLFVATNALVKLIDCDSFQFQQNGRVFPCDVGVAHFTPPELQNAKTFRGIRREQNHDNFGLAVIAFHLLFMGRHPFSGVYSGKEDMPIERAISSFRFAFSAAGTSKGMSPPPNCVSLQVVPQEIRNLFEAAFSTGGAVPNGRPNAVTWASALDRLRSSLRMCPNEHGHKFWQGLPACPWCELEQRSGILFFVTVIPTEAKGSFDIAVVWKRISMIPPPVAASPPDPSSIRVTPKPLPPAVQASRAWAIGRKVFAVGLVLGTLAVAPSAILFAGLIALVIFFLPTDESQERQIRNARLEQTKASWQTVQSEWHREAGGGMFTQAMDELRRARDQYDKLGGEYANEKQVLMSSLKERQLQQFLSLFFLDNHSIMNIGWGRKATLASFGIETAADITYQKVSAIKGFGHVLTTNLLDWRRSIEARFVFDASKGIDPQDMAALNHRFAQKRQGLVGVLLAGPERLERIRIETMKNKDRLQPRVQTVAHELAQAMADLNAL